jgi:N-acetylglutamate synthase-like GNAT family acetyltransferase
MISVRKATLRDSRMISELLVKKYKFETLAEASRAFCLEYRQRHHFRIAESDGRTLGILSWRPQGTLQHGVVELVRLAVVSDYPDPRQVKEELFDVMIAEADFIYRQHGVRLRKIFSMIHADAKHIKKFYLDKGMQQEAVLHNHFYNGRDELVFSLFLA